MLSRKTDKIAKIAKLGEIVFHTKDLANLWQTNSPNTLHMQIKRYIDKGVLFRIYKGFYSIKPINEIDPLLLGVKALHEFCYVSTETILSTEGIIQQKIGQITLISPQPKKFEIEDNKYYSRQLSNKYLYNPAGIKNINGINIANINRAVADILYFNPTTYFDAEKLINWKDVKKIQQEVGYPLTPKRYDTT